MTPEKFRNNELGYREWCENHPAGYVLNTYHDEIDAAYVVLHRAKCPTIDPTGDPEPRGFTGPLYSKLCADSIEELLSEIGREPWRCRKCNP